MEKLGTQVSVLLSFLSTSLGPSVNGEIGRTYGCMVVEETEARDGTGWEKHLVAERKTSLRCGPEGSCSSPLWED